jgi:hypothetical protein
MAVLARLCGLALGLPELSLVCGLGAQVGRVMAKPFSGFAQLAQGVAHQPGFIAQGLGLKDQGGGFMLPHVWSVPAFVLTSDPADRSP